MLEATSAAAVLEVMPLEPVQDPSPRPSSSSATSATVESPLLIVSLPVVRSTSPLPERSRPATLVLVEGATCPVPPAMTTSSLAERAAALASRSTPVCTVVLPVSVLA